MAEPYEKSDAYWQRETTANGRKINDVLDKHQESVEWAKVARLPESAREPFYNDRHDALQEKKAWRAHFDKAGELVTPTESWAKTEAADRKEWVQKMADSDEKRIGANGVYTAPWKSEAYWNREQTQRGQRINDVLDKIDSFRSHVRNLSFKEDSWDRIDQRLKAEWRAEGPVSVSDARELAASRREAASQPHNQPSPSDVSYARYLDDVAGSVNSGTAWKGHEDRMGGESIQAWEPDASVMPFVPSDNLSRFDPARIEQQLNRDWRNAPEPEANRISASDQAERASFREAAWSSASSGATQSRQNNAQTTQQTLRL